MDETAENLKCGERCTHCFSYHWRGMVTLGTLVLLSPLLFFKPYVELRCAYTVLVMAVYWVTEAMPIYITALIPIVVFPMFGIMHSESVCIAYFNNALLLFFGGILLALAVEHCNLHKRVGLSIILLVGCSPRRLQLGIIFVTMFLSMWISNTAAAALMCPVIKAILEELSAQGMVKMTDDTKRIEDEEPPYPSRSVISFYLGIAYAASIGGCGTLIGTAANLTFKGIYDSSFPQANDLNFFSFMLFNIPPMIIHTILLYLWLQILHMGLFRPNSSAAQEIAIGNEGKALCRDIIRESRQKLGPITLEEIQVSILFVLVVILFITRQPGIFTGWADLMNDKQIKDSGAMFAVVVLIFALPLNYAFLKYLICRKPAKEQTTPSLLNWNYVQKNVPWGVLLLLGGGSAIAVGMKESGLSKLLGQGLESLEVLPSPILQLLCIVLAMIVTNFTVNVAVCNIFAPIVLQMAVSVKVHPLYLGLPACMAFSMSFHFPVGTPPNSIAAAYGHIRTKDMMIAGIGPSIVTTLGYFLTSQTLAYIIFPGYNSFPSWAAEIKAITDAPK